jgi:UDP-N-acetylglucosamine 2-epimerase (non-hydrolysing)
MATRSPFVLVAGARPNFMKVAPIAREMRARKIPFKLINTGQHHDPALSTVFLQELGMGMPDFDLEVGSGTHAQTTARVMTALEPILQKLRPRALVVVGDVNSTLASTLTATKMHIPVAHVEAGLRSRDNSMPEEVNRILTDVVSDLLLTPSEDAVDNLRAEGIPQRKIVNVGNVMIDSLVYALGKLNGKRAGNPHRNTRMEIASPAIPPRPFLMTFHRPSNVDTKPRLLRLIRFIKSAAKLRPVMLPLHPRTKASLLQHGLLSKFQQIANLNILEPLGYFDFIKQMLAAEAIVTDSGGIQEETSFLGIPCLIMRTTTERPICIQKGTSELMGEDFPKTLGRLKVITSGKWKKPKGIPLWDGRTSKRVVSVLVRQF